MFVFLKENAKQSLDMMTSQSSINRTQIDHTHWSDHRTMSETPIKTVSTIEHCDISDKQLQ